VYDDEGLIRTVEFFHNIAGQDTDFHFELTKAVAELEL
jgi:hypothetical protein